MLLSEEAIRTRKKRNRDVAKTRAIGEHWLCGKRSTDVSKPISPLMCLSTASVNLSTYQCEVCCANSDTRWGCKWESSSNSTLKVQLYLFRRQENQATDQTDAQRLQKPVCAVHAHACTCKCRLKAPSGATSERHILGWHIRSCPLCLSVSSHSGFCSKVCYKENSPPPDDCSSSEFVFTSHF